jgi:type IV pilus assembly protein PilV
VSARYRRPVSGFTLIEVLIALVVVAVGMLGIAKLFIVALQNSASTSSGTAAVSLAADLADRIRANRTATAAYQANSPVAAAPGTVCVGGALSFAQVCTPAQMAAYDLYLWDQEVRCVGPGGVRAASCWAAGPTWTVTYTPNPAGTGPNSYTIQINWVEAETNTPNPAGQAMTYQLTVQI